MIMGDCIIRYFFIFLYPNLKQLKALLNVYLSYLAIKYRASYYMSLNSPPPEPNRFQGVKNGPKHPYQRDCTDFICCLLMLMNICLLAAFSLYGFTKGDSNNIYRATDQRGNICGATNSSTVNYPYTYFYNPTTNNVSRRTCVDSCPSYVNGSLSNINCFKAGNRLNKCDFDVIIQQNGSMMDQNVSTEHLMGYDSMSVIGRVCIPTSTVFANAFSSYKAAFSEGARQAGLANLVTDIEYNWRWLLLAMVLAVLISVLFMFFLRWFAGCFLWVSVLLIVIALLGLAVVFLYNGGVISHSSFTGNLGINMRNLPTCQYYNIFGYIVFMIAGLVILLVACSCSRIRLAVALCGVAGKFIAQTWQVVVVPLIMGFLVFALWVTAAISMVFLIGTSNFVVNRDDVFTSMQNHNSNSLGYFYYTVFATLWVNSLLLAITVFVIAATCAVWYYSKAPGVELDSPVISAFYMTFRYHFGSLSLGALIMAIVQFIQFIFEILAKQVQRQDEEQNKCLEYLVCCVSCCLGCIQKVIQILNKNAFIVIAVTGKDFISASSDAMALITGNPLRYSVVGAVGYILGIVGKLAISALTTFLFYLFITFVSSVKVNIQEPIYMLILVGISSYAVAVIFMSVFDVTVDSLLVCFLIDEKSNNKAVFAPTELSDVMDK